jgi:hypothetical protein
MSFVRNATAIPTNSGCWWCAINGLCLQYADQVTGPWITVSGAATSYQAPADGTQRFYRVHP